MVAIYNTPTVGCYERRTTEGTTGTVDGIGRDGALTSIGYVEKLSRWMNKRAPPGLAPLANGEPDTGVSALGFDLGDEPGLSLALNRDGVDRKTHTT